MMDSQKNNTRSRNTDAPTTEELKSRFQARSLPLEKDFHDLIDVAECGRRAVGKNPGQTPNPDSGLMLDDTQQLMVKADMAKGLAVSGSGVGVNIDTTLRFNNNQIGVPDNYVTKTGNSTIQNGSLSFETDNTGVHFYGGSKIVKASGSSMRWYKPSNNSMPQICNYDGSNPSNIATEQFAQTQAHIGAGFRDKTNGDIVAFEVSVWDPYWPVDIDFVFISDYLKSPGCVVSGRASTYLGESDTFKLPGINIHISNTSGGYATRIVLLQNISNKNLAIGLTVNGSGNVRWRARLNGGKFINKAINSFEGYSTIATAGL